MSQPELQSINPTAEYPNIGKFEWNMADYSIFHSLLDGFPKAKTQEEAAAMIPGICLKTKTDFHSMIHGIVIKNTANACIVIGHGMIMCKEEFFIWRGTRAEMIQVWNVD